MSGIVTLRAADDLLERIDAVAGKGGRSKFIRDAIEAALGSRPARKVKRGRVVEKPEPAGGVEPVPDAVDRPRNNFAEDDAMLLALLGGGPLMPRRAADALGWQLLRVDKAADRLDREKKIRVAGGLMELIDG